MLCFSEYRYRGRAVSMANSHSCWILFLRSTKDFLFFVLYILSCCSALTSVPGDTFSLFLLLLLSYSNFSMYFSNSCLKVPCFSKNQPCFFLPISVFYQFFPFPFFLNSFIILQNTTIYSLSSALDGSQSDFLCFHADTNLTSLANDKYISKSLPLLCLTRLQRTILIISIIMAKHFIQALMHAALISKGFSKVQSLPSSVHINHCFGFHLHCLNVWTFTPLISYVHWLPVQNLFDLENVLKLKGFFVSSSGSHPLSVLLVCFPFLQCLSSLSHWLPLQIMSVLILLTNSLSLPHTLHSKDLLVTCSKIRWIFSFLPTFCGFFCSVLKQILITDFYAWSYWVLCWVVRHWSPHHCFSPPLKKCHSLVSKLKYSWIF